MAVRRFDLVHLDRATPTPSGGLRIDAYPTRVGVLLYRDAAGNVVRELRPPDEVFAADSLASLAGAPVTHHHPDEPVGPTNYRTLAVGHVGDSVRIADDQIHVAAPVLVNDGAMVAAVQDGSLRELSCGYMADLDDTQGVWNGEPYDCIQRNIRYNHVALLEPGTGRAGSTVRLRLDSQDRVLVTMAKLIVDGKEFQSDSAECQAAVTALVKARDTVAGELAATKNALDESKKRLDAVSDPKVLTERVNARLRVLDSVNRARSLKGQNHLDAGSVEASSSDDLIMQAMKMLNPGFSAEGKSPEFIAGAFAATLSQLVESSTASPEAMPPAEDAVTSETPHEAPMPPPDTRTDDARRAVKGVKKPHDDAFADFEDPNPRWRQPMAVSKDVAR